MQTVQFIFEQTRQGPQRQLNDVDALDAKTIQLFSVASVVIGLAAFAFQSSGGWLVSVALFLAVVAFGGVAWFTLAALRARGFSGSDYASSLWDDYQNFEPDEIRRELVAHIPKLYKCNAVRIQEKARAFNCATWAASAEVVSIALALLAIRI